MQLAENRNLSNDVVLRLSPSRNSIIVEEKRPGGIVCYIGRIRLPPDCKA